MPDHVLVKSSSVRLVRAADIAARVAGAGRSVDLWSGKWPASTGRDECRELRRLRQPARLVDVHHVAGLVIGELDVVPEFLGDGEVGERVLRRVIGRRAIV